MRPATPHLVITTENSLFAGGHFHSKEFFDRSSKGLLLDHFYGYRLNNEIHDLAGTTFHRLAIEYAQFMCTNSNDAGDCLYPNDEQIAHFAVLLFHLDKMIPRMEKDVDFKYWHTTNNFAMDHEYAVKIFNIAIEDKIKADPNFKVVLSEAHAEFRRNVEACERVHSRKKADIKVPINEYILSYLKE